MVGTGQNIRQKMELAGVTIQDIRNALSFTTPHTIYRWLAGDSLPSMENLYALSELLDTPIDGLIVGNREKKFVWTPCQDKNCERR